MNKDSNPKIEEGIMVMKDGKGWGRDNSDHQCSSEGWMYPEYAIISDPQFITKPTDLTYKNSPYTEELTTGKLVKVRRTTKVELI